MHSHVKQMLEDDIIESSNISWPSPVVMVKKGEDKYRFSCRLQKIKQSEQV